MSHRHVHSTQTQKYRQNTQGTAGMVNSQGKKHWSHGHDREKAKEKESISAGADWPAEEDMVLY